METADSRTDFRELFPQWTDAQYRQFVLSFSPDARREARREKVQASHPDCIGEIYRDHLIEISLVSQHLMYGRLCVEIHTPDGQKIRPILHAKTGNMFKPNPKNPQSTVDWLIKRTKKFIDMCVETGTYSHCF